MGDIGPRKDGGVNEKINSKYSQIKLVKVPCIRTNLEVSS